MLLVILFFKIYIWNWVREREKHGGDEEEENLWRVIYESAKDVDGNRRERELARGPQALLIIPTN